MPTDRPISLKVAAEMINASPRMRVDAAHRPRPAQTVEKILDIKQNLREPPKVQPQYATERVRPPQSGPQKELAFEKVERLERPMLRPGPSMPGWGSYNGPLRNPAPLRHGDPNHAPKADVEKMLRSARTEQERAEPPQPQRKRDDRSR